MKEEEDEKTSVTNLSSKTTLYKILSVTRGCFTPN